MLFMLVFRRAYWRAFVNTWVNSRSAVATGRFPNFCYQGRIAQNLRVKHAKNLGEITDHPPFAFGSLMANEFKFITTRGERNY